ncbi:hypothetical protein PROFUN_00117 [Planoprotostelium fungivorum]|uniref:UV-endonuclease UvdE n=1 Tax=Planoprotostelium fungivorum TaxID=1890364 RepID=A0A2P6P0P1_9EUKA|nr:hypothetical protein PROFUN_00117 [Planoprotostelium fungivorum]
MSEEKSKPTETKPDEPLPKKTTTFKGRLGYACLNTVLRKMKPEPIFCSRTCRLATAREGGKDKIFGLALKNAQDLLPMLKWNDEHNIKFMRVSSEMFPFASHEEVGYLLKDVPGVPEVLAETGKWAREHGHRLTAHPGQFNQLGSPRESVIVNSIRTLERECEVLDLMGMGPDSVMIIHMGGKYDGKDKAMARFEENWKKVPKNVRDRIVLENDELCYNVEDLLPLCQKLKIPMVVDWHHDSINLSSKPLPEYIPAINEIFKERGIRPKQHYSEGRPGAVTVAERRGHSSRVMSLPPCADDVDLMIEAKDKEMAVLQLYQIYDLYPVDASIMTPDTKIGVKVRQPKKKKIETDDDEPKKGKKKIHRKKVIVKEGEEGEVYGEDMAELVDGSQMSQEKGEVVLKDSVEIVEKIPGKRKSRVKKESPAKKPKTVRAKKAQASVSESSEEDASERPKRASRAKKPNYKENMSSQDSSAEEIIEDEARTAATITPSRKSLTSRRRKGGSHETDSSETDADYSEDGYSSKSDGEVKKEVMGDDGKQHHSGVFAVKHSLAPAPKIEK